VFFNFRELEEKLKKNPWGYFFIKNPLGLKKDKII